MKRGAQLPGGPLWGPPTPRPPGQGSGCPQSLSSSVLGVGVFLLPDTALVWSLLSPRLHVSVQQPGSQGSRFRGGHSGTACPPSLLPAPLLVAVSTLPPTGPPADASGASQTRSRASALSGRVPVRGRRQSHQSAGRSLWVESFLVVRAGPWADRTETWGRPSHPGVLPEGAELGVGTGPSPLRCTSHAGARLRSL